MPKKEEDKQRELPWDPWDGEYIGNIWGWKFSLIGLGIISFFIILAAYRFATLDKNAIKSIDQTEISTDSSAIQ